jgi:membrane protein
MKAGIDTEERGLHSGESTKCVRGAGKVNELFRDPIGVIKEAVAGFQRDDGTGLSAEAAYRLVFALPALTIFFASVSSLAAQYTGVDAFETLLDRAQEGLPEEVFETLQLVFDSADEQGGAGLLSVGLIVALWSGSNAMNAIVKAINRAHGLEDNRGFVSQRGLALGLTVGLSLLMITSFALLVFGQQIGNELASVFGMGDVFTLVWNIARWPVLLILFMLALGILYRFAPAEHVERRALIPGIVSATILWLVASYAFSIYLTFADPGSAYGILGGILVLLLFLYLSSIVIVLGGEINATVLHRMHGTVGLIERQEHPLDLMPETIENPLVKTGAKAATWTVLGILVGGAVFGSLFRRGSDSGDG